MHRSPGASRFYLSKIVPGTVHLRFKKSSQLQYKPSLCQLARRGSEAGAEPSPQEELREWPGVYEEFLSLKKQCGEPTNTLTFEKFKGTLERNKAALVARHNCTRVKFTVYVKDGKAALKASPIK